MSFVWLDTETTGLSPTRDLLLAVGIIITDDNVIEVARNEWHVCQNLAHVQSRMGPYVREMHTKSGLLARLWHAEDSPRTLTPKICHWLREHLGDPEGRDVKTLPSLAGNSVHFDRRMLEENMPEVLHFVSYRILDVSSFKVLCKATIPGASDWDNSRPEAAHTPLADLEGSIAELAHWRSALKGAP